MDRSVPNRSLPRLLWIGGAPDAGKTTLADALGREFDLPVYHYDRADLRHHRLLAGMSSEYARFLDAGMDERWVNVSPTELADRAWRAFEDRFELVLEDLGMFAWPEESCVIAEGYGLVPECVAPLLKGAIGAYFLFPSEDFKRASMTRRRKGHFEGVSDPAKACRNLLARDLLLHDRLRADVVRLGLPCKKISDQGDVDALRAKLSGLLSASDPIGS